MHETDSVSSVYLAPTDGRPLPRPRRSVPGPAPAGERAPRVRTYSLSSAPDAELYRLSVKREEGGVGSGYLTSRRSRGPGPRGGEPAGDFVLVDGATPVLLLSAGIGVTPVLAMLHDARAAGQPAARSGGSAPHGPRPSTRWRGRRTTWCPACPTVTSGAPTARSTTRTSSRLPSRGGCPGTASPRLGLPTDATAYLCGPERFMADVRAGLLALGLAATQIRAEVFGSRTAINPGIVGGAVRAPHPPAVPGDGPLVTFSRSGLSVPYDTAQHSLLEMAELCDVPTPLLVPHGCVPHLFDGTPGRPRGLRAGFARAGGGREALLCCCHPAGDVVLDL